MASLKLFVKAFMLSQVIIDNILGKIVKTLSYHLGCVWFM